MYQDLQFWRVVTADIVIFFLFQKAYLEILTIKNDVWYRFLADIFNKVKELHFYSWFAEMIYQKWV